MPPNKLVVEEIAYSSKKAKISKLLIAGLVITHVAIDKVKAYIVDV